MPWFRVDDTFAEHPKLEQLEKQPKLFAWAVTVWVMMGADCMRRLTDGRCSLSRVRKVCSVLGKHAIEGSEALVRVGLWERDPDGYRFKNWAEYQPSRESVEREKVGKTERQRRWRDARRDAVVDASTAPSRDASRDGAVEPAPSHPIPIKKEISEEGEIASTSLRAPEPSLTTTHTLLLDEWTAERQSTTFRRKFMAIRQSDPSMHGKNVGDFHRRVRETADLRGETAEKLFERVLDRWLGRELNERERSSPYACFANAFGALVDTGEAKKAAETTRMERELAEVLRVFNGGRQNAG